MDDIKFMTGYNVEPSWLRELARGRDQKYYGSTRSLQLKQEVRRRGAINQHTLQPRSSPRSRRSSTPADLRRHASVASPRSLDSIADEEADVERQDQETRSTRRAPNVRGAPSSSSRRLLIDSLKRGAPTPHRALREEFRVRFRIDGILYN